MLLLMPTHRVAYPEKVQKNNRYALNMLSAGLMSLGPDGVNYSEDPPSIHTGHVHF